MKRKTLILIVLIFIAGFGLYSLTSKIENTSDTSSKTSVEKTVEPEIKITAAELSKQFSDNEIRANKEYKGKVVEITGNVDSIGEMLGSTFITLSSGVDFSITNVQCFFNDKSEIDKISKLNKDDKVVVIGKIDGMSLNVSIKNCRFK